MTLTWLPLTVSLLPIVTVALCYVLSASAGHIPACNPLWEGCTTVSSAGRYGISYWLFKLGVIPVAPLLAWFWILCRRWLISLDVPDSFGLRAAVWLGVTSAVFLVLYALFLGTQGDFYSLLRRFGVTIHFGCAYLAQVLILNRLWYGRGVGQLHAPRYVTNGMLVVALLMFALGLYSIPVEEIIPDPDKVIINTIEWNFALLLFGWYLLAALGWRASGYRLADVRNR